MPRAIITREPNSAPAEPVYWAVSYRDTRYDTYAVRVTWEARQTQSEAAMYCFGRRPEPCMKFYNLGPDWTIAKEKLKSVPLVPTE